ncbi:MAG: prolyl oligopeptidase family serine peptidase [Phycisphaerales bacterium]
MPRILCVLLVVLSIIPRAGAQDSRAEIARSRELARTYRDAFRDVSLDAQWSRDGSAFWFRSGNRAIRVDAATGERSDLFDPMALGLSLRVFDPGAPLGPVRPGAFELLGDDLAFIAPHRAEVLVYSAKTSLTRAADNRERALFTNPLRSEAVRSRAGRGDTSLLFVNTLAVPARAVWVNEGGERREYATIEPGKSYRQQTFAGHAWVVVADGRDVGFVVGRERPSLVVITPEVERAAPREEPPPERQPNTAPDASARITAREHNAVLSDPNDQNPRNLTTDGTEADGFRGEAWWAPDSSAVVIGWRHRGGSRSVHYIESSPRDQLQPKQHSYDYLKPGDDVPFTTPRLFRRDGTEVPLLRELFASPWSIDRLEWLPDSSAFVFVYNQRGHQVMRVVRVDAKTGEARAIVNEECATFFDYAGKFFLRTLPETNELIWMSERSGWNHLYLFDLTTGAPKNAITSGEWVVRDVEDVDVARREVLLRVSGVYATQDPYYIHYARVKFDGSAFTLLTDGDGTHELEFSPEHAFYLDRYSRVDRPPVIELRRATDGGKVADIARADDADLRAAGWRAPERFVAKARDGTTDIHGVIFRPSTFDAAKKYPVIEQIYAGPQGSFTPKSFAPWRGQQELAEMGFIVVQMDGMGTSNRSKAFHDVCWKNLGDAGFPDRIAWMKAAAATHPEMDLSRVGIYGGSAGGQNAMRAMIAHGDFYKAAAADCGCHDNRVDKIWWNELWMSHPIGDQYLESSNVEQAHRMQGNLLLTVGECDENVDPASTMQVVNALIKADKDFELLVIPGAGHGAGESDYARRRRADFFIRTLHP